MTTVYRICRLYYEIALLRICEKTRNWCQWNFPVRSVSDLLPPRKSVPKPQHLYFGRQSLKRINCDRLPRSSTRSSIIYVHVSSSSHIFALDERYHIFYFWILGHREPLKVFAKDIGSFIAVASHSHFNGSFLFRSVHVRDLIL